MIWGGTGWDFLRDIILFNITIWMVFIILISGNYGFPSMIIVFNLYIALQARKIERLNCVKGMLRRMHYDSVKTK